MNQRPYAILLFTLSIKIDSEVEEMTDKSFLQETDKGILCHVIEIFASISQLA